jgi:hypothetical protein
MHRPHEDALWAGVRLQGEVFNNTLYTTIHLCQYSGCAGEYKGKEILIQALTSQEYFNRLRLPDFKTIGT